MADDKDKKEKFYKKEFFYIFLAGIFMLSSGAWKLIDHLKPDEVAIPLDTEPTTTYVTSVTAIERNIKKSSDSIVTSKVTVDSVSADIQTTTEFLRININTASHDELKLLKGIGDHLADNIIQYRTEHGGFRNTAELMEVKGIGEAIFSDISDNVYVIDPVYEETAETTSEVIEPPAEIEESTIIETDTPLTLENVAPVDINSADAEILMLLPHIDEEKAARIIELREKLNGFSHPYELLYVEGLSQSDVAEIIEFVTVGD